MTFWRDKVVIVTGASRGFGRVLARTFAERGSHVVLASRNGELLGQTAEAMRGAGHEVLAVPTDVTCQRQVDALIQRTVEHYGRLDVLVNNAGRSPRGELLSTTPEDFQELMELNLVSVVRCTLAALPHLLDAQGHVVNIGSLASKTASRYVGAYPATKFAVAAYSQQLRLELAARGLHVLLVCPGPILGDDSRPRETEKMRDLPESVRKPGAGVKLARLRPEKVAREILTACERRRPELVLPRRARLLFVLSQLSPRLGDWLLRRMT